MRPASDEESAGVFDPRGTGSQPVCCLIRVFRWGRCSFILTKEGLRPLALTQEGSRLCSAGLQAGTSPRRAAPSHRLAGLLPAACTLRRVAGRHVVRARGFGRAKKGFNSSFLSRRFAREVFTLLAFRISLATCHSSLLLSRSCQRLHIVHQRSHARIDDSSPNSLCAPRPPPAPPTSTGRNVS